MLASIHPSSTLPLSSALPPSPISRRPSPVTDSKTTFVLASYPIVSLPLHTHARTQTACSTRAAATQASTPSLVPSPACHLSLLHAPPTPPPASSIKPRAQASSKHQGPPGAFWKGFVVSITTTYNYNNNNNDDIDNTNDGARLRHELSVLPLSPAGSAADPEAFFPIFFFLSALLLFLAFGPETPNSPSSSASSPPLLQHPPRQTHWRPKRLTGVPLLLLATWYASLFFFSIPFHSLHSRRWFRVQAPSYHTLFAQPFQVETCGIPARVPPSVPFSFSLLCPPSLLWYPCSSPPGQAVQLTPSPLALSCCSSSSSSSSLLKG